MALFSKNKPTKRVEFEGGWVELQFLSKGIKNEYQSSMAGLYKDLEGVDEEKIKALQKDDSKKDELPEGINLESLLNKVNNADYYKLSHAIKAWSEEEAITEETVKELDDEVFNKISEEVDNMNELKVDERKN